MADSPSWMTGLHSIGLCLKIFLNPAADAKLGCRLADTLFLCKENHALDAWFKEAYWYKKFDYTITGYND